jgi:hypothetical protein
MYGLLLVVVVRHTLTLTIQIVGAMVVAVGILVGMVGMGETVLVVQVVGVVVVGAVPLLS